MTTYAIGDVQGCYTALSALLEKIDFDKDKDRLWFTGDLVNRGPQSLAVLRFVMALGDHAVTVLGNHDLHLLAIANGHCEQKKFDTLDTILTAADRHELLEWLRWRPLLHRDETLGVTMVHAGLSPQWSLSMAQQYAGEVEQVLRSDRYDDFLANMYGNEPDYWSEDLKAWDRLRYITNVFSRIRYCTPDGRLNLVEKGAPEQAPSPLKPWYTVEKSRDWGDTIVFGHWSTLNYFHENNICCLDSGCLWGGQLTALALDGADAMSTYQVDCEAQQPVE